MTYALGPIRPDERHERIFVRRHPRRAVVAAVAVVVTLLLAGGFYAIYRALISTAAPGGVPMIRADAQPTRKRPDNPGGTQIIGQGTLVLDRAHDDASKVERILPSPEAPLPRPAPVEPPAAAPTPPTPSTAAPAPEPSASVPPAAPATAPPPAQTSVAAPSATTAGKGYRLQLGAVRTSGDAKQEWERLKRLNGDVLGALGFTAERVDLGSRGIFYRIQAGPLANAGLAERNCSELQRRGIRCILVRP
jgi:cell division septation protein DedD